MSNRLHPLRALHSISGDDGGERVRSECAHVEENWFAQTFDHFNSTGDSSATPSQTYGQRYYLNRAYFDSTRASPLVFLLIGGEWTMGLDDVCFENMTFVHAAKEHGALAIQLEHRFFGKNKNMT